MAHIQPHSSPRHHIHNFCIRLLFGVSVVQYLYCKVPYALTRPVAEAWHTLVGGNLICSSYPSSRGPRWSHPPHSHLLSHSIPRRHNPLRKPVEVRQQQGSAPARFCLSPDRGLLFCNGVYRAFLPGTGTTYTSPGRHCTVMDTAVVPASSRHLDRTP